MDRHFSTWAKTLVKRLNAVWNFAQLLNLINAETASRETADTAIQAQVDANTAKSYSKLESDTKYLDKVAGVAADASKLGGNAASFYSPAVHSHGDEYIKPTGGTITGNLIVNGTVTATELIETSARKYKDNEGNMLLIIYEFHNILYHYYNWYTDLMITIVCIRHSSSL